MSENPEWSSEQDLASGETLQKAAVDLLWFKGAKDKALLLLNCDVRASWKIEDSSWPNAPTRWRVDVYLAGPPAVYQALVDIFEARSDLVTEAFRAAASSGDGFEELDRVYIRLEVEPPYLGWRETHAAQIQGDVAPTNQGVVGSFQPSFKWNGLGFRSKTETVIAAALARRGLLFFPNAAAVAGSQKREPDFVICTPEGKWGILEINGDDYHPPERFAQESERARWFKKLGIPIVEAYDARWCYNEPDNVIDEFLQLLSRK
jgi:hypothetical protein